MRAHVSVGHIHINERDFPLIVMINLTTGQYGYSKRNLLCL